MARGDHIFTFRKGGIYSHHGIDCGDGSVVHLWGSTWSDTSVRRSAIDDFAPASQLHVAPDEDTPPRLPSRRLARSLHHAAQERLDRQRGFPSDDTDRSPDAVVQRALGELGRSGFDFFSYNCEHFAYWCRTGRSQSRQIDALWWAVLDPVGYLANRSSHVAGAIAGEATTPALYLGGRRALGAM